MIRFTTIPLKYEGTLENDVFQVPESPSTEAVLNSHARVWTGWQFGMLDPELELYNFVANRWQFINLESRTSNSQQMPLEFSLS
jgi:hypothetical protein